MVHLPEPGTLAGARTLTPHGASLTISVMRNRRLAVIGAIDLGTAAAVPLAPRFGALRDGQAVITDGLQCATEGVRVQNETGPVR